MKLSLSPELAMQLLTLLVLIFKKLSIPYHPSIDKPNYYFFLPPHRCGQDVDLYPGSLVNKKFQILDSKKPVAPLYDQGINI